MAATNRDWLETAKLGSTEIIISTSGNLVLELRFFLAVFLIASFGHEFMLLAFSVYCQVYENKLYPFRFFV